jgi:hypothetical protein
MGRARKDEMREANNSHIGHFMRGGRASSSSSEDSLSPRPRGRHTERVERTDFILTSQERAAKDLDRDRDRDRDRSFPKEKSSSRERSPSVPRKARAAPSSSPRREEMAPPMASAGAALSLAEKKALRETRFGTGVSTGGGASGAAAAPRPVVAPRPARSPSPDLREVATKKFMRKHIYNDLGREDRAARFGLPAPLTADAERTAATRFSATPHIPASTTIRMDRDAKKRFRDL